MWIIMTYTLQFNCQLTDEPGLVDCCLDPEG